MPKNNNIYLRQQRSPVGELVYRPRCRVCEDEFVRFGDREFEEDGDAAGEDQETFVTLSGLTLPGYRGTTHCGLNEPRIGT